MKSRWLLEISEHRRKGERSSLCVFCLHTGFAIHRRVRNAEWSHDGHKDPIASRVNGSHEIAVKAESCLEEHFLKIAAVVRIEIVPKSRKRFRDGLQSAHR